MILAAVNDLFFSSKINEAAKALGLRIHFVKNAEEFAGKSDEDRPRLIIVDLNAAPCDPIQAIQAIKQDQSLSATTVIGYLSHVQLDLKEKATQAGCDIVLPRSAFSQNLAALLERYGK